MSTERSRKSGSSVAADGTAARPAPSTARTKDLLICGAVAGPLFVATFLILGSIRSDYDPMRHSISSLALGELGWIQIVNFVVAGVLTLAFAVGARRVLLRQGTSRWGPLLIGLWAVSLLGAGVFVTDPTAGYPPGTPLEIEDPTAYGIVHNLFAGLGFSALAAACFVFARRFARRHERNWAVLSVATGIAFLTSVVLASYGFPRTEGLGEFGGFVQRLAVICGWAWITALAIFLMRMSRTNDQA